MVAMPLLQRATSFGDVSSIEMQSDLLDKIRGTKITANATGGVTKGSSLNYLRFDICGDSIMTTCPRKTRSTNSARKIDDAKHSRGNARHIRTARKWHKLRRRGAAGSAMGSSNRRH